MKSGRTNRLVWHGWSITHKTAIRIFLQNDMPMLFTNKVQAQSWCDERETPVQVRLSIIHEKRKRKQRKIVTGEKDADDTNQVSPAMREILGLKLNN